MTKSIKEKDVVVLVDNASEIIDNTIQKVKWDLIVMHWNIGKIINDYREKNNSKYGDNVVVRFSEELSRKYGNGFRRRNIELMCLFHKKSSREN